jgi:hypothetical protein
VQAEFLWRHILVSVYLEDSKGDDESITFRHVLRKKILGMGLGNSSVSFPVEDLNYTVVELFDSGVSVPVC